MIFTSLMILAEDFTVDNGYGNGTAQRARDHAHPDLGLALRARTHDARGFGLDGGFSISHTSIIA
jgi:hypothetical protein